MAESSQFISSLNRLARLCKASEKGFNIAAENVKNRGLKVLFKTYAQQRSQMGHALQNEIKGLGGRPSSGTGPVAALHRGWINIKSAMTIGQPATERVVIDEVVRGERVALQNFADSLKLDLPKGSQSLVKRHHETIQKTYEQMLKMQGRYGQRLIVRLFDSQAALGDGLRHLATKGVAASQMESMELEKVMDIYPAHNTNETIRDSAGAGAFGGALLGAALGIIVGLTAHLPGGFMAEMGMVQALAITVVAGVGLFAIFGALIGSLIGLGVAQEDEFSYASSVAEGHYLLMATVDTGRADEAALLLKQINAKYRSNGLSQA